MRILGETVIRLEEHLRNRHPLELGDPWTPTFEDGDRAVRCEMALRFGENLNSGVKCDISLPHSAVKQSALEDCLGLQTMARALAD